MGFIPDNQESSGFTPDEPKLDGFTPDSENPKRQATSYEDIIPYRPASLSPSDIGSAVVHNLKIPYNLANRAVSAVSEPAVEGFVGGSNLINKYGLKALQSVGAVPEMKSATVRNPETGVPELQMVPVEPWRLSRDAPLLSLPRPEQSNKVGWRKAIEEAPADLVEGLSKPEMIPQLAATIANPSLAAPLFLPSTVKGTVESTEQALNPNLSDYERGKAAVGALENAAFTGAIAHGLNAPEVKSGLGQETIKRLAKEDALAQLERERLDRQQEVRSALEQMRLRQFQNKLEGVDNPMIGPLELASPPSPSGFKAPSPFSFTPEEPNFEGTEISQPVSPALKSAEQIVAERKQPVFSTPLKTAAEAAKERKESNNPGQKLWYSSNNSIGEKQTPQGEKIYGLSLTSDPGYASEYSKTGTVNQFDISNAKLKPVSFDYGMTITKEKRDAILNEGYDGVSFTGISGQPEVALLKDVHKFVKTLNPIESSWNELISKGDPISKKLYRIYRNKGFELPSDYKLVGEDYIKESGKITSAIQSASESLPDWAREEMSRRGIPTDRQFNDIDLGNPSVVDAIKSDPTLTDVQKESLLKTGGKESNARSQSKSAQLSELEVRPRMGEETPLRQQGEAANAQGIANDATGIGEGPKEITALNVTPEQAGEIVSTGKTQGKPAHELGVEMGIKLGESDVPALKESLASATKDLIEASKSGDAKRLNDAFSRQLLISGAIEGASRSGPNYAEFIRRSSESKPFEFVRSTPNGDMYLEKKYGSSFLVPKGATEADVLAKATEVRKSYESSEPSKDPILNAIDKAIEKTSPEENGPKGKTFEGVTSLPAWLTEKAVNEAFKVLRKVYLATKDSAKALAAGIDYLRGLKLEGFNEAEARSVLNFEQPQKQSPAVAPKSQVELTAVPETAQKTGGTAGETLTGSTFERETGKPTTAMQKKPGVEPMDYIPETESGRSSEADRIIANFNGNYDAALNYLERPPEMSGIPVGVRVVAGEKIAQEAARQEMASGNLPDADRWRDIRRRADNMARSELSQSGQALQTGAQIARQYADTGAGQLSKAEKVFDDMKELDKNFPDLPQEAKRKIYESGEEINKLNTLSEAEKNGRTEEQQAEFLRKKQAATSRERLRLKINIETEIARAKLNNGWKGWLTPEGRALRAKALNELASANMLLTPTFFPKQFIDVAAAQLPYHLYTRALAHIAELPRTGNFAERSGKALADAMGEIVSTMKDAVSSLAPALRYGAEGFKGRGSHFRETMALSKDLHVFERAEQKIQEAIKSKQYWKAVWPAIYSQMKWGLRFAKALDEFSGTMVENTEIRQMVEKQLRDNGASPADARKQARSAIHDALSNYAMAAQEAQLFLSAVKDRVPESEYRAMVWDLAHQNALENVRRLNLDPNAIENEAVRVGRTFAWNQREIGHGPGGILVGTPMEAWRKYLEKLGVPTPFLSFANAISIGVNKAATNAGLGLFPRMFEGSPFFKTPKDIAQRRIEAIHGLALTGLFSALAYNGLIRVRNNLSQNKDEREKQYQAGHRWGTIEINTGDGKFVPISMSTGPLAPFRAQLSAIGAIQDLNEQREKYLKESQQKAGEDLTLENFENKGDLAGVLLGAASSGIFGGRTLGGAQGALLNQDTGFDIKQPLASATTSLTPFMPAEKSFERLSGINQDPKRSSLLALITPSPLGLGENGEKINAWGDRLNPQFNSKIIATLTGGTVPGEIGGNPDPVIDFAIRSGWWPHQLQDSMYRFENDTLQKLSESQRREYLKVRGDYIRNEMKPLVDAWSKQPAESLDYEDIAKEFEKANFNGDREAKEKLGIVTRRKR